VGTVWACDAFWSIIHGTILAERTRKKGIR
jgi:hypothetical protein